MKKKQKFIKITEITLVIISLLSVFSASFSAFAVTNDTEIITETTVALAPPVEIATNNNVNDNTNNIQNNTENKENVVESTTIVANEDTSKEDINSAGNTTGTTGNLSDTPIKEYLGPFDGSYKYSTFKICFKGNAPIAEDFESDSIHFSITNKITGDVTELAAYKQYNYETSAIVNPGKYTIEIYSDENYESFKLESCEIEVLDKSETYEIEISSVTKQSRIRDFFKNNSFFLILLAALSIGLIIVKKREENNLTKGFN